MDAEHFKYLYESEWQRRAEIRQATALPAGVLTLLAGVLTYYGRTYSFPPGCLSLLFALSLAGAVIASAVALVFLCLSLFGPKYKHLPYPSVQLAYSDGVRAHYGPEAPGIESANVDLARDLVELYANAADRNTQNNFNAGEYLHKANGTLVLALLCVGIATVPAILDARATQSLQDHRKPPSAVEQSRDSVERRRIQRPEQLTAPRDSAPKAGAP